MSSEQTARITPSMNGPYWVNDIANFANRKGALRTQRSMVLCRCGASAHKPFCDGTHVKIGFSSANSVNRVEHKRESYQGRHITIHDNRSICAHAGRCTDGLPGVFRMNKEPWIDADAASREEISAVVRQCPSGALSYSVDGVEHRDGEGDPTIFIAPNGPYVVTGGAELHDTMLAQDASTEHYTLCRCGGSKNKPFCDGTHWQIGFVDEQN
ncbi:MAG: CDGSH iron-sulfur domain-containing protein [Burkholderiales bacterium]